MAPNQSFGGLSANLGSSGTNTHFIQQVALLVVAESGAAGCWFDLTQLNCRWANHQRQYHDVIPQAWVYQVKGHQTVMIQVKWRTAIEFMTSTSIAVDPGHVGKFFP